MAHRAVLPPPPLTTPVPCLPSKLPTTPILHLPSQHPLLVSAPLKAHSRWWSMLRLLRHLQVLHTPSTPLQTKNRCLHLPGTMAQFPGMKQYGDWRPWGIMTGELYVCMVCTSYSSTNNGWVRWILSGEQQKSLICGDGGYHTATKTAKVFSSANVIQL